MFGLFKKKKAPEGPIEIEASIEIAAAAEHVFALIDFADPRNAKRELGHSLVQRGDDAYDLVMSFMPDDVFPITDIKSVPHSHYSYRSELPEGLGRLLYTLESYDIEAIGPDSCAVTMRVVGEFAAGMSLKEFQHEVATLTVGCNNAFAKLKVHAEGGVDEVRAFEAEQSA